MKLGIFSRLTIGYLALFVLLVASNFYGILQLHRFNAGLLHILKVDTGILDEKKRLVDSAFTQVRYERKYILTKDPVLQNQFLEARNEFKKYLARVDGLADTPQKKDALGKVRTHHDYYGSLVNAELKYLNENKPYSRIWYEVEKEKALDGILKELENIESESREGVYSMMEMLRNVGVSAAKKGALLSLVTVLLAISAPFFITRSITKPLATLVRRTREVSKGIFKTDLKISSPPEISELSEAFNLMCERLKAADKMKSDFFAVVSHELRTPLTSMKEGTSLLLEGVGGRITEKQAELLTVLAEETKRLIDLVNSMLDFSKMEAGMMTYTFERESIAPVIERAMMEMATLMEAKRIRFEREIDRDLPLVRMDAERVLQALRNLIGNAVKFTPEDGRITISACPVKDGVEIHVKDTGPGIPEANLTTIFEKFRTSDQKKGTGLGLAIVKHVITAHGGKVWVESKTGEGSAFIFVLPS